MNSAPADVIHSTGHLLQRITPTAVTVGLFIVAACGRATFAPVALTPADVCSYCKMAISETQYAAEILTEDGEPLPFDDLACLALYLKERQVNVGAIFVMDYSSRTWVKAEDAHFLRSPRFKTPMSGGIAAFREKARAEAALRDFGGELMTLAQVLARSERSDK
jgi:copper chaperone NosL